MTSPFQDKVIMITGAASGFGKATAERFAKMGAKLAISDINDEGLNALASELKQQGSAVLAMPVDVTSETQIQDHVAAIEAEFGRLDVGVNNAGAAKGLTRLPDLSVDEFDWTLSVNAKSVFLCMKHQIPLILRNGKQLDTNNRPLGGAIVNLASAAGILGAGHLSAYAAAKHAVVGLTRSAAEELARKNVRVNAICPAFADTPLFHGTADDLAARSGITRQEASDRITSRVPMQRAATPDEIVEAIVFASHPDNSFMTGQTINIDGGLSAI